MSNKAKIREAAKKLNPIDDLMFRKMAEDKLFCEEILRVILEDENLTVLESIPQHSGTNLQGRSVIMDAKCKTGDGKEVNIEVQQANDDNHQKRVRYNGSILTTNLTDPGLKFEKVPDICVVFIARFDIFKGNKALYHVDRVVREMGTVVNNGFEEVYVNAMAKDGSIVSELMEVFVEDDAYSKKFPRTSEGKHRYKETEGGQKTMCEIMDKIAREERLEGIAEGREEGLAEGLIKGEKKGLVKGRAEGIIELGREIGLTEEQILEKLQNKFSITKEEAEEYMKEFSA